MQLRRGARHRRRGDNFLDRGQRPGAVGGFDVAHVDLALGIRRGRIDRLAAGDQPDIEGDALGKIGQRMDLHDLVREFADRADALGKIAAGMRRLA